MSKNLLVNRCDLLRPVPPNQALHCHHEKEIRQLSAHRRTDDGMILNIVKYKNRASSVSSHIHLETAMPAGLDVARDCHDAPVHHAETIERCNQSL